MPKYRVYAIMSASKFIGEIEAKDEEEAEELAWEHDNADNPRLCHRCAKELDIGDMHKLDIEEIKDK